jgi:hypothetical protein
MSNDEIDTDIELNNIIKKYTYKKFVFSFRGKSSYKMKKMLVLLQKLELNDFDKNLLMGRIIDIYTNIEHKYNRYSRYYTFSVLTTTIASILTTTFLSLNNTLKSTPGFYWTTWGLSLCISIINAFSTFYKWDRKYILLFQVLSRLEHEIWTFIELVGIYHISKNKNTFGEYYHKEKLKLFMHRIENIFKTLNKNLIDIDDNDDKKTDDANKTLHSPFGLGNQHESYANLSSFQKSFKNRSTKLEEIQLTSEIDNEISSRTKDIEKITNFSLTEQEKRNINNMIKKNIRNELDKRIKEMIDNDIFIKPEDVTKIIKNINNERVINVDIENQSIAKDIISARSIDKNDSINSDSSNHYDIDKEDIIASVSLNNMNNSPRNEPTISKLISDLLYIEDSAVPSDNNTSDTNKKNVGFNQDHSNI